MLTASGSALVSGASPSAMKTVFIKVVRPFLHKRERVEVDTVLEVDRALGTELKSCGKVVFVDKPQEPAKPAAKTAKKEAKDAGQ